jgi:Flp pilus assembly protein TadB
VSTSHPATGPGQTGPQDGRSLGDIVSDVANDLSTLVRQELDLAKTEAKQEATRAGKGAGMLVGAAVAGLLLLLFLSAALMYLLDNWMPVEVAALIVAAVWLVVALVLASAGRKALKSANPQLPQTQRSLKEDAQWAKQQKS